MKKNITNSFHKQIVRLVWAFHPSKIALVMSMFVCIISRYFWGENKCGLSHKYYTVRQPNRWAYEWERTKKKTRTEKDGGSWKCPDQKTLNSISFEKNLKWNVWIFVNKGRWMNYTLFLLLQFYFFSLSLFLFGRWFYRNAHWFVLGSFSLSFVDFVIKINTLCTDDLYILIFFRSFRCFNISSNRFFMAHQEGEWRERWMDDIDDENCAGNFSCFFFLRSLSLYISRHINRWIYICIWLLYSALWTQFLCGPGDFFSFHPFNVYIDR